jgi:ribosomal protein S18 acetylase RimI-like enzyme
MMQFAEQHAHSCQYTSIRLDAFLQNKAACNLYNKLGYTHRGNVRFRMGQFCCYEKVL